MLATSSESLSQARPQQWFHAYSRDAAKQMQERITELQEALELELALRCISEAIEACPDETHILKTVVQALALELEADCCALLDQNLEIDQQLRAGDFQFYFHPNSQEKITWFTCPISDGCEPLGTLWVTQEVSKMFTDPEIYLIQQVARQCAIAIHRLRLHQSTQAQIDELKRLNELKNDFLVQVAHDLRSPLSNMRLAIELLEHQFTADPHRDQLAQQKAAPSKAIAHLHILQTECERGIELLDDLLDLQQLESDPQLSKLDVINLKPWLSQLVQPFEGRIQQRRLTLNLHLSSALPPLVSNSNRLHRALSELIHNACKYTPPDEIISLRVTADLERLQIKVSNSGVEIPAEELSRIFDKFYRIPGSDRWNQGGTGLGLALVKNLIADLGGTIEAESGNGRTCFTIVLPL